MYDTQNIDEVICKYKSWTLWYNPEGRGFDSIYH